MNSAVIPEPLSAAAAMIPKTPTRWQLAMREVITDSQELLDTLGLKNADLPISLSAQEQFSLRVPRSYVARMQYGNPRDPLLLQILPQYAEQLMVDGFVKDPVGDLACERTKGLLQKYPGRVLIITTGACAIHCRYCFRREFPYADQNASSGHWQAVLDSIHRDQTIEEVILSGGDPLSLTDARLAALARELDAVPHLKRLRIHTRQPVVLPERVDDALLKWLASTRLQTIMVTHCNHAQEIDDQVKRAFKRIQEVKVQMFNQAVLLKGVNNDLQSLVQLSGALFSCGVVPYYLHQLDRVQGAAHFEVPDHEALRLHQELQNSLPGYMVPRLVREVPNELSKRLLQETIGFQEFNHD